MVRRTASVIAGQNGEKTTRTSIPAQQNRTKCLRLHPSRLIAGQNWRYSPRMTYNERSRGAGMAEGWIRFNVTALNSQARSWACIPGGLFSVAAPMALWAPMAPGRFRVTAA
jgi:hypothetical protein